MGLRLRLLLVVILPMAFVVGGYGIVRVREETRNAIEAERRQAAVAASAVRTAVEHAREYSDVRRLAAELVATHAEISDRHHRVWRVEGAERGHGTRGDDIS